MSRNSPDSSLRVFNSIAHYGLDITRSVLGALVGRGAPGGHQRRPDGGLFRPQLPLQVGELLQEFREGPLRKGLPGAAALVLLKGA